MAQESTNFIGGRMNKSVDERLIPPGEYIDAMNVRLGSTENTEIGAVENSLGNTILTNVQYMSLPLGSPRTIGVYEDGMRETLYWFINDENNPNSPTGKVDLILSYNTTTGNLTYHVISTEVLNFDKKYLITGVNKIENLLFFTDDLNPPRVMNVNQQPNYSYASDTGGFDTEFFEEDISVIVKPPGYEDFDTALGQIAPLGSPHVQEVNAPLDETYMEDKFLSFAYRYRYEDGGYSATSLFTQPAFEPGPFQFSIQNYTNIGMRNRIRAVDVTFSTGSRRVLEVNLLYKQTTSNVIYLIKRYHKADLGWADNEFRTVNFSNSEIYTTLGSDELLRLYDNVPRIAKAQTIQGNRLIYGNYIDGYDIRATEDGPLLPIELIVTPNSELIAGVSLGNNSTASPGVAANPVGSAGAYISAGPGAPISITDSVLTWDISEANPGPGSTIEIGTTFNFSFEMSQDQIYCDEGGTNTECTDANAFVQSSPFPVNLLFITTVAYNDVDEMVSSDEFANKIGGASSQLLPSGTPFLAPAIVQTLYPCNNSDLGGTLSDKFYQTSPAPMTGTNLELISGGMFDAASFCATPIIPFPLVCSSAVIAGGVTECDPGLTPCAAGFLTDMSVPDWAAVPGVAVGGQVMNMITGDTATITSVTPGSDQLGIGAPATGTALVDLATGGTPATATAPAVLGVPYNITNPAAGVPPCAPSGFVLTPGAPGSGQFSLQVPATQYFFGDGTAPNFSNAFIYYSFVPFGCSAGYLKTSKTGSLHSNRDYEVGIVYMDDFGRASTVLTSQTSTVYIPPSKSVEKNSIRVQLSNLPPYWASKYKFVVKPSEGTYQTIYSNIFYAQDGTAEQTSGAPLAAMNDKTQIWFRLDGDNQNILKVGDEIQCKRDTNGAVITEAKSVVLAIESFSGKGITKTSLKGLYMLLKPDGWTTELPDDAFYMRGNITKDNTSPSNTANGCIHNYNLNDSNGDPYSLPAGSAIRIQINNWRGGGGSRCNSVRIKFDKTYISTANYQTFHQWAIGDDMQSQITTGNANEVDEMQIKFSPTLYTSASAACNLEQFVAWLSVRQTSTGSQFFVNSGGIQECYEWFEHYNGHNNLRIEVSRAPGMFCWETTPADADPNLFYDASSLLDIYTEPTTGVRYHAAERTFNPQGITGPAYSLPVLNLDQSAASDLYNNLTTYNCYTFGNGVESFRINDSPAGKGFNLGERTLAVSNQDFKEANRFAGMTYSGVFSGPANSNNLNEFNLGLLNYKDCETGFGPIQILHSRETDILVLQEDRISYVLAGKNVITDSTGGGAIASVPQVLGTQIARIEEYGISFNPESFSSWGSDMFFTDAKRGAVINLRGASKDNDQLQVVSSYGMNSWFRNEFNVRLTTQKLGAYDPYMKEYVLSSNDQQVPMPIDEVSCGSRIEQMDSILPITYTVNLGLVIGQVDIPYMVSSGSITVTITWGGVTVVGPTTVNTNGSFSFQKTLNTPQYCTVEIVPLATGSTYNLTVECPPEVPLTIIQVVINSQNYDGETIHTKYNWNNTSYVSPSSMASGTQPAALTIPQAAVWVVNTGIRSLGLFPHDGADITLVSDKISPDTFDFDPLEHKFRILSSPTLYSDTTADRALLLAASSVISPIVNPSAGTYKATETAFSMPLVNEYLYLIWDLRVVGSQNVCYCTNPSSSTEICCECEVACTSCYFGPLVASYPLVCGSDTNTAGNLGLCGFYGTGGLPTLGSQCFTNIACNPIAWSWLGLFDYSTIVDPGFYIVDNNQPATSNPKRWVQIGANGIVIADGSC